jgi:two-component system, chemotaxis family, sensor kinase CheA
VANGSDSPFAGFMDDYFAEAEEHLVAVRRGLLTLEDAIGSELPSAVLDELFRSFHSLKGISAMVELREAELLAHHMEGCLRALRHGEFALTSDTFEPLVDGARTLESVISAHRAHQPPPSIERIVRQLEGVARTGQTAAAGAASAAGAPSPTPPVGTMWRVTFSPSPELVERGVKVDTIRTRLQSIGRIAAIAPKVQAGAITFDFEVETEDEAGLAEWRDDGVSYERMASATPADTGGPEPLAPEVDPLGPLPVSRPAAAAANFVRVDLARLDDLMRIVGDLVVMRARLDDTLQRVEGHVPFQEWRALQEHNAGIERQVRDLREAVMRVRLVPVGEIFRRMPFVVRDLARDHGKRVQLELKGQTTEIDKFLIERMMDPVLHLVRNAISHAIETPSERVARGKRPEGTIRLGASTAGESVVLEISDDGEGIDVEAVTKRARAEGIAIPDGAIDDRTLLDLISASGFSTRDEADRGSGRGMGMAVVRQTVRELGGTILLRTVRGQGTTFSIVLPLTLAITDAIIAQVGDHTFAIPQSSVREVIEVDPGAVHALERNELMTHRGVSLPVVRLANLFGIVAERRPRLHAIVAGVGLAAVGLVVDRIVGQREIVVKTITDPLIRVRGVSGATELGDGRLVLILDVAALIPATDGASHVIHGLTA